MKIICLTDCRTMSIKPNSKLFEVLIKAALKEISERISARMAGNYDDNLAWEERYEQLTHQAEHLERNIQTAKQVIASDIAKIKLMPVKRQQTTQRQSLGQLFTDFMALTIPVPPTKASAVSILF